MLLTACQPGTPKPNLSTAQLVGCVANLDVSKEDQADAGRELNTLKEDSVIANTIVPDWIRMRAANKSCIK
jgi:phosphoribosylformylglycinamidine (FGAM) synthase PurS component